MTHGKSDASESLAHTGRSLGPSPATADPARRAPEDAPAESVPPAGGVAWKAERLHFHSGPLPTPETLAGYEALLPGAADRVFAMVERDMDHQHATETAV